jgi:asparagine synthase (glutamine-hydrolysing)
MCGIAGAVSLSGAKIPDLPRRLAKADELIRHRGPDGQGTWMHSTGRVGFAHRRLSIIDLEQGAQPMSEPASGDWITYNGEIYNFIELREEIGPQAFTTKSDTEVILRAYEKWGVDSLVRMRGMYAFALWDESTATLLCARDRFGIKPFYYTIAGDVLYFASEAKALLPFVEHIDTDVDGLKDYFAFQFCLSGKTLFKDVHELLPGHLLLVKNGRVETRRYWDVYYDIDFDHTEKYFEEHIRSLFFDSVRLHLRSDVPVGAYVSGGFDSSLVAAIAAERSTKTLAGFHGKFTFGPDYDESRYARALAKKYGIELFELDIAEQDFTENIRSVIRHLDYPIAGPGSFPQYMVSRLAAKHRKVVLGGQGGDEIFGGYVRYLIAYFEQCIKAAIDGTMRTGNFIVTYESIIPNLSALKKYKPMLQEFWKEGLFDELDKRYFRLINRTPGASPEIRWAELGPYSPFETFRGIFHAKNVRKESYFDSMTHFDFKTLLPALLHVEDRVSMAHGLEARVPFLDGPLVELAATMPSNVKFKDGTMKHIIKRSLSDILPQEITTREDKMGFPVPLLEWFSGSLKDFVHDVFMTQAALSRPLIDNRRVLEGLATEPRFGRKIWGLLCLELWQQEFHDQEASLKFRPDGPPVGQSPPFPLGRGPEPVR